MEEFKRKCPKCNNEIIYKSKIVCNRANKNKTVCKICSKENLRIKKQKRLEKEQTTKYIHNCPQCGIEIIYKNEKALNNAKKNNTKCKKCMYKKQEKRIIILKRKCPNCNDIILYHSIKSFIKAADNNILCIRCSKCKNNNLKLYSKLNQEYIKHNGIRKCPDCNNDITYTSLRTYVQAILFNIKCKNCRKKPENNPMYGKSVYNVWVQKYGKEIADQKELQRKQKALNTFKQNDNGKCSIRMSQQNKGKNNFMYGKSVYDIWVQKYGKEEADKRQQQKIEKCRKASSGENNAMYGKPAPEGSGNGWSGHYHNIYFRSILELYYLIYLIDNNIKFENGELKKYHIPYTLPNGNKRNYLPDYYLPETDQIIEIKPKNLVNSFENKLKFAAAKEKLGNKHIILTENEIAKISIERLWQLYQEKELIFDDRYIERFENYYNKNRKEDN